MKKFLMVLLAFFLIGCTPTQKNEKEDIQETKTEIEKAKEIVAELVFDGGKGYKCKAYEQRIADASSVDIDYYNTYIYETYRAPDQNISICYRFSGNENIYTYVALNDQYGNYKIGNDSSEYVMLLSPLGEVSSKGSEYVSNLKDYLFELMDDVKNVVIKDDCIEIEYNDQMNSVKLEYQIQEQKIESIQMTRYENDHEDSIYIYTPIGDGMKKAEEISLLVQNAAFEINVDELPFKDHLKQSKEVSEVIDKIHNLDFSIADPVDVYIQDVQNKTNTVINSIDFDQSVNSTYIEYWFNYNQNDELTDFNCYSHQFEESEVNLITMKKVNNFEKEYSTINPMFKNIFELLEPLYSIKEVISIDYQEENIEIKFKADEGYVKVLYVIENNRLKEMREELYSDSAFNQVAYKFYISKQVPSWEYFESQFNSVENRSIEEVKKLDYFKAGL